MDYTGYGFSGLRLDYTGYNFNDFNGYFVFLRLRFLNLHSTTVNFAHGRKNKKLRISEKTNLKRRKC